MHYLEHILHSWSFLLKHDENLRARLDPSTVEHLQGLAPQFSLADRRKISSLIRDGRLFPALHDRELRRVVHERLLQFSGRIPSFYTFTEDTIYLEAPVKALRLLLPDAPQSSIRESAFKAYTLLHYESDALLQYQRSLRHSVDQVIGWDIRGSPPTGPFIPHATHSIPLFNHTLQHALIQVSEDTFQPGNVAYGYDAEVAYCQLWLYALRHFPCLVGIAPRRRSRGPAKTYLVREEARTNFARLAYALGYDSKGSTTPSQEGLTRLVGRTSEERYPSGSPGERVSRARFQMADREPASHPIPKPSVSEDDDSLETQFRWGKPFLKDFEESRKHLFYQFVYDNTEQDPGQFVTSFAITRDIFLAFFGRAPELFDAIGPFDDRPEEADALASPALLQHEDRQLETETDAPGSRARAVTPPLPAPQAIQSAQDRTSPSSVYTLQSDVETSRPSTISRTRHKYMLTHEDVYEVGFILQDAEGAYRIPLQDSQFGIRLNTLFKGFNEPVVLYLYEPGRFFLERLNSKQLDRRIQTLNHGHTFFGFTEKGIEYLKRSQLGSFIAEARFIFVRRRLKLEQNLERLPHAMKKQIAVLWEMFPSTRPTRSVPWILEAEPFHHEPQRRFSIRWPFTIELSGEERLPSLRF